MNKYSPTADELQAVKDWYGRLCSLFREEQKDLAKHGRGARYEDARLHLWLQSLEMIFDQVRDQERDDTIERTKREIPMKEQT